MSLVLVISIWTLGHFSRFYNFLSFCIWYWLSTLLNSCLFSSLSLETVKNHYFWCSIIFQITTRVFDNFFFNAICKVVLVIITITQKRSRNILFLDIILILLLIILHRKLCFWIIIDKKLYINNKYIFIRYII